MIRIYLVLLITMVLTGVFPKPYWVQPVVITTLIATFFILITIAKIAIFAAAMNLCSKQISATKFNLIYGHIKP
jgi:PAT family beta-lactamase induction signal transducer AmpG